MDQISSLEKILGYKFNNQELLYVALRHRSAGGKSNERMEFLGDAVLSFVIAAELYKRYPKLREGQLSRLRSNLVKRETLAELAKDFSIGDYLYLGSGEKKSGGFRRGSILADALEAIIGAIYLDSDTNVCEQVILAWYSARLSTLTLVAEKDAKSELQEFLQKQQLPLPSYEIIDIKGQSHQQIFYVRCRVVGYDFIAEGEGSSKQEAEQISAQKFLLELKARYCVQDKT